MVKSILDTDILSEYLKGHDTTVAGHAARYANEFGIFTFTSVTVYEIVYGLDLKQAASQLKKALAWLKQNEETTPTDADYLAAATIKAAARKNGAILELSRLSDCRNRGSSRSPSGVRQHRGLSGDSKNRRQIESRELAAPSAILKAHPCANP